jgi:hypothetical protein
MIFRSNAFTSDTDSDHLARATEMADGLAIHGLDLGFLAPEIEVFTAYPAIFETALFKMDEEKADVDEKYTALHDEEDAVRAQYSACQKTIIGEMAVATEDVKAYLESRFDIYGSQPNSQSGFINVAASMLKGYDDLAVEHPDILLPAVPFEDLRTKLTSFSVTTGEISEEVSQKREATVEKNLERGMGNKYLSRGFHRALAFWGDNDSRLLELGFVPKSMIWTDNKPYSPKNLSYDEPTGTFSWDIVDDVDSYQLDCRLNNSTGDWTIMYEGTENSTISKPPTPAEYDIRCRAIAGDTLGNWCTPITVDFTQ